MRNVYLLVYSIEITRSEIREWANASHFVLTWRYELPNSFYLVSEDSADILASDFREFLRDRGRFLITEISDNRQGWLSADTWYLLKNKKLKKKN